MINNNDYNKKCEYNKIDPYLKAKKEYNNNNLHNIIEKNLNNGYISPLRRSCDYNIKVNKLKPYQNENLTINRISPSHVLYRPLDYDDGGYLNENYSYNQNNIKKEITQINNRYNKKNDINNNQRYLTSENVENKYSNIYGFKSSDERRYKNYLRNPYYKGEDTDDGYKHYNPEENNFSGSTYGGYIYNYYLNAPMRSDKTENWRFPPLYYVKPKYK